ncbi:MAG TPA: ATP-binding protein [Steroidobacteraceae bacterium]|jgi:two-component system sensor histidine kinase UhpB
MRVRTRVNLVVASLSAAFVVVLIAAEVQSTRNSIREEIEAANRVASQLLSQLAHVYSNVGGPDMVQQFLMQIGRVRANEVTLLGADHQVLYRAPAATYKAGREAPAWFARLLAPPVVKVTYPLPGGLALLVESQPSRAVLDAWDDTQRLALIGVAMFLIANALAFWLMARVLRPIPVIVEGLQQLERGRLGYRLPPLAGEEAALIGRAFNRMAEALEEKLAVERQAREAEARLVERREIAALTEQRVEEERRLIAHELHDEFGQSVTAIRSLALAIAQGGTRELSPEEVARLIAAEAAKLYDAMHGLIPRLAPVTLDAEGLAATLEGLIRDWQRRYPTVALELTQKLPAALGFTVTLVVYRVVQEALINALRHAHASRVNIEVEHDAACIKVSVSDDGIGLPAEWQRPGHFGLRGLADRVQGLGGSLEVGNRAPRGVRLAAQIPIATA